MKVAYAHEMQEIDRLAQVKYNLSGDLLMERAALAAREVVLCDYGAVADLSVYLFCGKGNNGGDGLALARLLAERQARVTVVLAETPADYSGLAAVNLQRAYKYGLRVVEWPQLDQRELSEAVFLVDALLGTGAKGAPRENLAALITKLNQLRKPVYALDLPSGINVDTGQVALVAVQAETTITFGLPQPGLLCYPGASHTGKLVVASLGFPAGLLAADHLAVNYLSSGEAPAFLPRRQPDAHKGNGGHLLVLGGAPGMTGAVALATRGALRSGSGLVTAGLREPGAWPEKPAEVMTLAWREALTRLDGYAGVVVGPGLGTTDEGADLLEQLLAGCQAPLVVDADGLNLLAGQPEWWSKLGPTAILTPHPGEMARLTGLTVPQVQADRLGVARHYAQTWGVVVVLKGARTIIALPEGSAYINLTGNSGMATAGMGDALAGIIGGVLAQGLTVAQASVGGTYLHGLAGDLAARIKGPIGIVAGDLVEQLPAAYQAILSLDN
ncbi:MAG: NAD(P)H-hydrate dehydratase [Bacillota bacterium]|jgi:NAD(P)H-hydrate epimerase